MISWDFYFASAPIRIIGDQIRTPADMILLTAVRVLNTFTKLSESASGHRIALSVGLCLFIFSKLWAISPHPLAYGAWFSLNLWRTMDSILIPAQTHTRVVINWTLSFEIMEEHSRADARERVASKINLPPDAQPTHTHKPLVISIEEDKAFYSPWFAWALFPFERGSEKLWGKPSSPDLSEDMIKMPTQLRNCCLVP